MAVAFARRARARLPCVAFVFAAQQRLEHSPAPALQRPNPAPAAHKVPAWSATLCLATKRFWTLSVWEDETPLRVFVAAPPHAAVMKALAPHNGRDALHALDREGF